MIDFKRETTDIPRVKGIQTKFLLFLVMLGMGFALFAQPLGAATEFYRQNTLRNPNPHAPLRYVYTNKNYFSHQTPKQPHCIQRGQALCLAPRPNSRFSTQNKYSNPLAQKNALSPFLRGIYKYKTYQNN